jgi:hypothetical protein
MHVFLKMIWNNIWLETEKGQWIHEIYPDLRSRKQANYNLTPEMVHLTEHGSFAKKMTQINLKESDEYI